VKTGEIWKHHPENALCLRADFVDKNPLAARALLMAVLEPSNGATPRPTWRRLHDLGSAIGSMCRLSTLFDASR